MKKLLSNKKVRFCISLAAVVLSAFLQTFVIKTFIQPSNLLSSGFTGVAILIDKIATLYGGNVSTSIAILLLNAPVAIICYKSISPKFTLLSCVQFSLTSFFLSVLEFPPIFEDVVLNVIFGGFIYGICVVIALKGNASTGGTDFIALYVSNKIGKSIWEYVFVFNAIILCIFGFMFGWLHAGYSILFQFICTKTIDAFHHRYERVTLEITTMHPEEVIDVYIAAFRHGITCVEGYGGYSKQKMFLLHTVVSSYEVQDVVSIMKEADSRILVNVFKTEQFYGNFYQKPID